MPAIDPRTRVRALAFVLAVCTAATAMADEPPDRLFGEQPYEEPSVAPHSDDWLPSYVPNLVDVPAAELVERHHPTLELSFDRRRFGREAFDNVQDVDLSAARFAFHIRMGRDIQLSLQFPLIKPELTLITGAPALPGTLGAAAFELKYLSPYEVVGVRTALGVRFAAWDGDDVALFAPDDFSRLQSAYVTFGAFPRSDLRLHLTAMSVFAHGIPGFESPDYGLMGAGVEYTPFVRGDNYVRFIGELVKRSFDGPEHGFYGRIQRPDRAFGNVALRARTGILQVDVGSRHVSERGWREQFATVVKRF